MRKAVVRTTPLLKRIVDFFKTYRHYPNFPNGHFYSPITNADEVEEQELMLWPEELPTQILGVNLNEEVQLQHHQFIVESAASMPFKETKQEGFRYFLDNPQYSFSDGIVLHGFLNKYKPKRIIEVGAGYSSALMLDCNQHYFNHEIEFTFIEPFPKRLKGLLAAGDSTKHRILEKKVQQVKVQEFEKLESGDILFIDSSHVLKTGSDLYYLFFQVLPRLKKGVVVHIHDIFYPFEYPKEWAMHGRNWNELYFLHALLVNNQKLSILYFTDYIAQIHTNKLNQCPLMKKSRGGSIWLQIEDSNG